MFAYGAQYYRRPNPPVEQWHDDLQRMAEMEFNTVKAWADWSNLHTSEDDFDFDDLGAFAEMAGDYGLEVHLSVNLENAPHWLAHAHPDARYEDSDGNKVDLQARPNTPTGGWPGLCLNHPAVRRHGTRFMEATGERFASVDAVTHLAIWDEAFFEPHVYYGDRRYCYCAECVDAFRQWLRDRYGDLEALDAAWAHSFSEWGQVQPPRFHGGYPRHLDWLRFRLDDHQRHMEWRAETLREASSTATIRGHGIAGNLGTLPHYFNDDWRSASLVDEWGVSSFPGATEGQTTGGDDTYAAAGDVTDQMVGHLLTLDAARGAARGKRFWQTELQGGFLTSGSAFEPRGLTRSPDPTPEQIALWNWNALAAGSKGILYWQYRPESLGPESPGFGLARRDGAPTERTDVAERFARIVADNPELEAGSPVRGDLALGLLPDGPLFNYVAERDTEQFSQTVRGAYEALWELDYQVDVAKPSTFGSYDAVYLPFPILLDSDTAATIDTYVHEGGTLVADGCPAVYGEDGRLFRDAPGYDLQDVFGVRLERTRFAGDERLGFAAGEIGSTARRDVFQCESASPIARWSDGGVGAAINQYGAGEAIVIGTLAGAVHGAADGDGIRSAFGTLLERLDVTPATKTNRRGTYTRLHRFDGGTVLYVVNTENGSRAVDVDADVRLEEADRVVGDVSLRDGEGAPGVTVDGHAGGAVIYRDQ